MRPVRCSRATASGPRRCMPIGVQLTRDPSCRAPAATGPSCPRRSSPPPRLILISRVHGDVRALGASAMARARRPAPRMDARVPQGRVPILGGRRKPARIRVAAEPPPSLRESCSARQSAAPRRRLHRPGREGHLERNRDARAIQLIARERDEVVNVGALERQYGVKLRGSNAALCIAGHGVGDRRTRQAVHLSGRVNRAEPVHV